MASEKTKPIISLSNVNFEHKPGSFKLSDISFDIFPGTFVILTGPNGSGKSTLGLLLNGIYKPISGKVVIDGMSTSDKSKLPDIRKKVGIVFQNPYIQFVGNTVEEDVAFGPENLGLSSKEIKKRVKSALNAVGMSGYENRNPVDLSGGEAQKVAIAGVLATNPKVIVFDEVTSMLDLKSSKQILNIVNNLKSQGKTIVFICHDPRPISNADKIYTVSAGKIVFSGTYSEYILSGKYPVSDITELLLHFKKNGYPVDVLLKDPKTVYSHLAEVLNLNREKD